MKMRGGNIRIPPLLIIILTGHIGVVVQVLLAKNQVITFCKLDCGF
jgi:hypothetical protein